MAQATHTIPILQTILDERIYPRAGIDRKRVSMFAENSNQQVCHHVLKEVEASK